jgi:hypothetical protein
MPPKLRTKMSFEEDEPEDTGNSKVANILGLVMLVAIVGLSALFWTSFQHQKVVDKQKADAAAKTAAEQAQADSLAKRSADSLFAARQDSITAYEKLHPKPKTPAPTAAAAGGATGAPAADAVPPPPPTKFGIDVGGFMTQDRASSEQTKLQGSTSLSGRVVSKGDGFHVVIGEFTSKKDAQKKATELILAGTIPQGDPVKLAP